MEIFMRMPGQLLGNEIYKAFVQLLLRLTHFKASRWNRGGLSPSFASLVYLKCFFHIPSHLAVNACSGDSSSRFHFTTQFALQTSGKL
jgi:hypothetical protein